MTLQKTGNITPNLDLEEHAHIGGEGGVAAKKVIILGENGEHITNFGARYGVNNVDEASSTLTYVGQEDSEGEWVIKKIDTSAGITISYATKLNNPSYTDYSSAWSNRATLSYGSYKDAF